MSQGVKQKANAYHHNSGFAFIHKAAGCLTPYFIRPYSFASPYHYGFAFYKSNIRENEITVNNIVACKGIKKRRMERRF